MGTDRPRPRTTTDPTVAVVIPWRDSGDPQRLADFNHTRRYYADLNPHVLVATHDGRQSGPFNRHAAYNRGYQRTHDADVVLWVEADTLIPEAQITEAAHLALEEPGLVIPYTERHELDITQTEQVFAGTVDPFTLRGAANVFANGDSIGQAGVTSHATIDAIGGRWDDDFEGWGYDDNAALYLFATLAGPTRWVTGKGIHLWHTPAYVAATPESEAVTQANAMRLRTLTQMTRAELEAHTRGEGVVA